MIFQNLNKNNSKLNITVFVILVCLITPYFYLANFVHPISDDFCYTLLGLRENFLETVINEYFRWNGRYSSNFLVILNPMVWNNLNVYQLIPQLLITGTFLSFAFLFYTIFKTIIPLINILNLGLIFTLLFIYQMPSVAEGFYWYTGSISYQAASVIFLFYLGSLIKYNNKEFLISKTLHLSFNCMLLILMIGFNEVIMLLLVLFHFVIAYKNHHHDSSFKFAANTLFLVSILAGSAVFFAPGNSYRESNFIDNHNILRSVIFTFMQSIRFFLDWISNIPFVLGSVLSINFVQQFRDKNSLIKNSFYLKPYESSILLIGIFIVCIFPPYWATNILGQHRTINTAYFFFILMWFVNLISWTNYLEKKFIFKLNINPKIKLLFIALIIASLSFTKNGYTSFLDIFYGKAKKFDLEMRERNNLIYQAKKENRKKIIFKPLSEKPQTIFVSDFTKDPKIWINRCQGDYYGGIELLIE